MILTNQAPSNAACIAIVTSSVSVAGKAGANSYTQASSGECVGTTADGSIWKANSSGELTTSGATVNSSCDLISGSGSDWSPGGSSRATLIGVFRPFSPSLTFEFTGSAGYHAFESYIDYSLKDVTTNTLIDNIHWAQEWGWEGGTSLPYTATYTLDMAHEYQLVIYAQSRTGDWRHGYSNLELKIVPEASPVLLATVGLVGLSLMRKRTAHH